MRYRLKLDRLNQILAASRLSQNHWALRLGLSRGHWSDIVNGNHPHPSARTRQAMLDVFGVPAEDLFEPDDDEQPAEVDFRMAIATRWEITREIGQGGMGTVYLANDISLGRLVAVKAVSKEAAAGVGTTGLLQEISLVSRLQHPNILPLFEAGERAGTPFYVMPFIREGSLRDWLVAKSRLSIDETVALVDGIAAGLAHAHEHRVLHCDLKPENILLQGTHAFVMDFGIARKIHSEALEWAAQRRDLDYSAGTPAYVSPEQAAGEADLDARSDVYSLGCIVYEMLAGRPPFEGTTTLEIVSRRFHERAASLRSLAPDVTASVQAVVERAMSLERADRQHSAAEFARELSAAARGASRTRTSVAVRSRRMRRWIRNQVGSTPSPGRSMRFGERAASIGRDVVFAFRQRRRSAGLTAVSILTLACGIGLTTAVFTLVDGVLLRPLPFDRPEQLVALSGMDSAGTRIDRVSSDDWGDWKDRNRTMAGIAIEQSFRISVAAADSAARIPASQVSPNFFEVLGVHPLAGRYFDSAEVAHGNASVVVSEGYWRRVLGSRPLDTLTVSVNGFPQDVIGVVPSNQVFPEETQVWLPYRQRRFGGAARNNINWDVVGRLKPGVTAEAARADLSAIARAIHDAEPQAIYSYGVTVRDLRETLVGDTKNLLRMLLGAVLLVLLITCANLASANLAHAASREREMAVRAALGAGRLRLVRQVLVEHGMLALAGGMLGVLFAWLLTRSATFVAASELPRADSIHVDVPVLLMSLGVSILAALLTGLLPALQASRARPDAAIGDGSRAVRGGRGLPGQFLVGAEIAMAVMLVTGAGLLVRSFRAVIAQPLGFTTDNVVTGEIVLGGPRYSRDSVAVLAYWQRLLQSVREGPGVAAAGLANWVPLGAGGTSFIDIAGKDVPNAGAGYRVISEGYLEAMRIPLLEGRELDERDDAGTPRVALINRRMAGMYWPGESPLGKMVRAPSMEQIDPRFPAQWITIVGVVGDVRHWGYESLPQPEMYVAYRQVAAWRQVGLTLVVRGASGSADLLRLVRDRIHAVDPSVAADLGYLEARAERATASRRFSMTMLSLFGLLSLALAAIGVYGVLAFAVAQRTRELAVRAALGADRRTLHRLVMGSGARVVAAGVVVGLAGSFVMARLVRSLLFDVGAHDPVVLTAAVVTIFGVGMLAALLPAHRATLIDPMTALREG